MDDIMLDRFFILVGAIVLSTVSSLKNISFRSENETKDNKDERVSSSFIKNILRKIRKHPQKAMTE